MSGLIYFSAIRTNHSKCSLVRLSSLKWSDAHSYCYCHILTTLTKYVFWYRITTFHHTGLHNITERKCKQAAQNASAGRRLITPAVEQEQWSSFSQSSRHSPEERVPRQFGMKVLYHTFCKGTPPLKEPQLTFRDTGNEDTTAYVKGKRHWRHYSLRKGKTAMKTLQPT
jgi:hypothetical protein